MVEIIDDLSSFSNALEDELLLEKKRIYANWLIVLKNKAHCLSILLKKELPCDFSIKKSILLWLNKLLSRHKKYEYDTLDGEYLRTFEDRKTYTLRIECIESVVWRTLPLKNKLLNKEEVKKIRSNLVLERDKTIELLKCVQNEYFLLEKSDLNY